jgi:phosphoribosylanthranilate isomerase
MWKPVFRQVRVRPETTPESLAAQMQPHLDAGRVVLLDRYDEKTPGGSGKSFDWSVAEGIASRERVLLAGGLTPENVAKAVQQLRPWGVDVSSGVETDGQKDHAKIRAFIEAARSP